MRQGTKVRGGDDCRRSANEERSPTQLDDVLGESLDIIFCGINPALSAARSGHHFSHPNNRFWPALHLAGFTPHRIRPEDDRLILHHRYGLTSAVGRPTVSAGELARHEFSAAAEALDKKVRRYHPRFLAFLGKPAFAAIFNRTSVVWGRQTVRFGGADVWVLPNPSGLNRAFTLEGLVSAYRELRIASQEPR